jgi:hypothetical protein
VAGLNSKFRTDGLSTAFPKAMPVIATDFAPIEQLRLQKFQGDTWHLFGDIISAEVGD